MSISTAADKLADSIVETYFQPLSKPLPGWARFLCAWMGSATLFASFHITNAGLGKVMDSATKLDDIFVSIILPAVYGVLIAIARTKQGPMRLYISGMFMSLLVIGMVLGAWRIA